MMGVKFQKLKFGFKYALFLFVIIIICDVILFKKIFNLGYPSHYEEENVERFPAPYIGFKGKPYERDHNEFGYRGEPYSLSDSNSLKIAFFGGSTGYGGSPPIAEIIKEELKKQLNREVFVANFSVISSNHRQHLHAMIEYLPLYKPDIVIFYGGYNETIQSAFYDPRPGYPYNYFYRGELSPIKKVLLENSAILGSIDKKFGVISGISELRGEQKPLSDEWNKKIFNKYFETLHFANRLTKCLNDNNLTFSKFFAFYQPYQVPEKFVKTHNMIRDSIGLLPYGFDVSEVYNQLEKNVYVDIVHVIQFGREIMGKKIADKIVEELYNVDIKNENGALVLHNKNL